MTSENSLSAADIAAVTGNRGMSGFGSADEVMRQALQKLRSM